MIEPVDLGGIDVHYLAEASAEDWSKVNPAIFGTLFQASMDQEERHAFGAHFTSEADIMKIVLPTIVRPWRERIENAGTMKELLALREDLKNFKVLDPACGSGNFLYCAYRELKRIEVDLLLKVRHEFRMGDKSQLRTLVSIRQMYGFDILPFAVELTKVTLLLAKELAIQECRSKLSSFYQEIDVDPALPLDNLDGNIRCVDALFEPWPKTDVVIGNPPFTGAKWLRKAHGSDYVRKLRKAYPSVPGMADYCVFWFRKAHEHLPACERGTPAAGRAGLVGTQNIRHNKSRVGGLDFVTCSGSIIEAVDDQPWSGEANVNVSIVNWVKTKDPSLLPERRRLWFRVTPDAGARRNGRALESELNFRECAFINSTLTDSTNVSTAARLGCNQTPQRVFQGITPGHDGFVLSPAEYRALLAKDEASSPVAFPYLIGRELVKGDGRPQRFVIDFGTRTILEAQAFAGAFERVKAKVLPARKKKAEDGQGPDGEYMIEHKQGLERWWRLWRDRDEMKHSFAALKERYIACSRTQLQPFIFCFVSKAILAGDKLQTFALDDDYSFGILQAAPHLTWIAAKGARTPAGSFVYSAESVFETYPWPQTPTRRQVETIAAAAEQVRAVRTASLPVKGGLRGLYSSLALPGANALKDAHSALDDAVREAYGMPKKADTLAFLLALNKDYAAREEDGKPIVGPGLPPGMSGYVTKDCISLDYSRKPSTGTSPASEHRPRRPFAGQ